MINNNNELIYITISVKASYYYIDFYDRELIMSVISEVAEKYGLPVSHNTVSILINEQYFLDIKIGIPTNEDADTIGSFICEVSRKLKEKIPEDD